MRESKLMKKFHALVIAFAMIASQLVAVALVMADTPLPIAQYVTSEGSAQCGADHKSATYNGTVKMNVPMTEVLATHESEMKQAADKGLYPHGREGKNRIAYIEYTVTFPEAVTIGEIKKVNTSSIINGNKIIHTVNGNKVNFKMYLNDTNWAGVYSAYNADKANPGAHTVNIEIPYQITASSKEDAKKYESENITGSGDFSFYPAGFLAMAGSGLTTFNSDNASIQFAKDMQNCFEGTAEQFNLNLSSVVRDKDGEGIENSTSIKINAGAKWSDIKAEAIEAVKAQLKEGYVLTDEWLHDGPNLTNREAVNDNTTFDKGDWAIVKLEKESSTFNLAILPDNGVQSTTAGIDVESGDTWGKVKARFEKVVSADPGYEIDKWTLDTKDEADTKLDDNTELIKGKATGVRVYSKKKNLEPKLIEAEGDLEGDLLIGGETEHNKVFETSKGATHDFTGALNVKPIKEQMTAYEKQFNYPDGAKIKLSDMDTTFTATIELPEGMKFDSENPETVLAGVKDVFEKTESKKTGNKVTVIMKLKDADKIKTYSDLSNAINSVEDTLKVIVKGAKFTGSAKPETNYTVKGTLSGNFKAKATKEDSGQEIDFNLNWNGKQSKDGADAIAPADFSKITFTLKYKKPQVQDYHRDEILYGDLLIGDETEHDKIFETKKDASHDFTGALNVKPIKEQMIKLEEQYKNVAADAISLSGMDTTFTATIELPKEMTFGNKTPKATLAGDNGKFEITKTKLDGNKVTVTLKLKNVESFKTYKELADAIKSVDDTLKVTVEGAKFTSAAKAGTDYTVKGTVSGNFKSTATHNMTGNAINFSFDWSGKQLKSGADAKYPDSDNITFTLKYKKPAPKPDVNPDANVNTGDNTRMLLYLFTGLAALLVIIGIVVYKRKNEK